jgi:16S rRNA C967 or C1407 C5-methylase (RsmB/RsmF family)
MIPNQAFITYFEKTFFPDPIERNAFLASLTQSLRRSIRVNTRLITPEKLRQRLESQGWKLTITDSPTLFLIERGDNFSGIDERLGFSLEHLLGLFYIQELSAASSVEVLTS